MIDAAIAERGPALPPGSAPYRHLGPFDAAAIPAGLLRRHDLKPDVWGMVTVETGAIRFCWDDEQGGGRLLVAGDTMLVPPTVPHHLEVDGKVGIRIAFWAPPAHGVA